jgi:hypothetical protein
MVPNFGSAAKSYGVRNASAVVSVSAKSRQELPQMIGEIASGFRQEQEAGDFTRNSRSLSRHEVQLFNEKLMEAASGFDCLQAVFVASGVARFRRTI